ncbi:HAMP domain-containing sensor histidine kinase [Flavisolibacter tropicus]|uniref:histidine kinase n=1 Tax=Flavisolibacter tropicus TaxID=1492898 RepID=A0A172U1U6_9BACT|nr:HAMP domain-containing sensor histidine kinase [Flavisolibacter tropicus]ANE52977.1 histidine kinase [Flavisolibacter tropicus]
MPVRLRITLLFTALGCLILCLVCTSAYYFSYTSRIHSIRARLTNRAITTARLLSQAEIFDKELIRRIDSSTTITLKDKTVQAYDYQNHRIYSYSDKPGDTLSISEQTLDDSRVNSPVYFAEGTKDAIAYHYTSPTTRIVIVVAANDVEGKKYLQYLTHVLFFSFLGGILMTFIGGYLFSKGLLRPVRKIADEVSEISAQNLATRIQTGTVQDEWYHLSTTMNELLNRLQESFDLQKRFIANASHELSTPLTSISSQLEIALQRERSASEYRNIIQSVYQDVQQMNRLTQTLLEFAKASGSAGGLEIAQVRMDEIVLQMPAEVSKFKKEYIVVVDFQNLPENEEQLIVFGNEALLFLALKNIVINACKYSQDHKARITLAYNQDAVEVTVTDKGKGIPEPEWQNIFQPFYRVQENTNEEGFGLGLSLSGRIIKLHKGTIQVQSQVDQGSSFIITLPTALSLKNNSTF